MKGEELKPQRLFTPTTKVRRLGYFVIFCSIIKNEMSFSLFAEQILKRKEILHSELSRYCRSLPAKRRGNDAITGEITGEDSLNRYYLTASEMGLLEKIGNTVFLTKRGQILASLSSKNNPFDLTIPQIHFLLRVILEKDSDYQRPLINIILDGKTFKQEDRVFQEAVEDVWLKKKDKAASLDKMKEFDSLRKSLEDLLGWESPRRYYFENIRATRLEWLLDLKLLKYWNISKNRILIEPKFAEFFKGTGEQYSRKFHYCFEELLKTQIVDWRTLSESEKNVWLRSLLDEAMKLFSSEEYMNKISADQFFEYSTSKMIGEGILIDTEDLEKDIVRLLASQRAPYRFVRIVSDVDTGYISRI